MIGCATKGPSFPEFAPSINELSQNTGRIYFYRTTVFGAALQPKVKMNDEIIGTSIARGFFYVDKKPGNYQIMTTTEVDRKLSFILEDGQTRYVRFGVSIGFFLGHVYPELVSPEVGIEEIQECNYTGDLKTSNDIPAMSGITTDNIKVNEKEPWTGKWKVDSASRFNGIWAMKQEGKTVKSIKGSDIVFKGKIQGNQLKGNVDYSGDFLPFIIEIPSDGMSFKGSLDYFGGIQYILKGNRIE